MAQLLGNPLIINLKSKIVNAKIGKPYNEKLGNFKISES